MRGMRKSPAGFPMDPSAWPAAFQCDATGSGRAGYAAKVTRKVTMIPAMIANLMSFIHRYWSAIP
jgi:hypothetical protein